MMRYHRLAPGDLAALASGLGGTPVVHELRASQLSRHLLLLKFLSEQWPIDRRRLEAAVDTLAAAQQIDPATYADLLGDPLVGAWLATTTRRLRRAESTAFPLTGDLLHLGGLAASAAVRLGLDCEVIGYARHGQLTLPATGEASVVGEVDGPLPITVSRGQTSLLGDGWRGLRRLSARHGGLAVAVKVEDGNPYRDGYHAPPSERLSDEEFGRWQDMFAEAWELICRFLPERAAELAVGLRAVVPLVDDGSGAARSGTARDSVGALGLTRPRSAVDFAITIVHEFQHSKLSAVLGLVDLYQPSGAERHFAPWRVDPRPTAGLIQGVYAFLGVADAWLGLRASAELEQVATDQLAIVREQVRVGLDALAASTELTALGRHFTTGMRVGVDRLFADALPADAVRRAESSLADRRAAWQRRRSGPAARAS
jgi:HEXXH motif-containing protein